MPKQTIRLIDLLKEVPHGKIFQIKSELLTRLEITPTNLDKILYRGVSVDWKKLDLAKKIISEYV